eukprot:TRINITY_DN1646_c0_g1_i1.p1 TRINITY_DN1646_c0_g1~~TRINITY_DN1646_c0_g1_i1.p1  ORF type:complete len:665 (+),score=127.25 TRINITY_DN1646_c0_g1_i1:117-2111(+)
MPSSTADGESGSVTLDTFLGEWKDSMGNKVNVDWAKGNSCRGELDVWLTTRGGKHIQLGVKSLRGGNFQCGHYNLDTDESHTDHIVWLDIKDKRKNSVWKRPNDSRDDRSGSGWNHRDSRADWSRGDAWKQGADKWSSRDDTWKDRNAREETGNTEDDLNALWNSGKKHDDEYDDGKRRRSNKASWNRDDSRERHRGQVPGVSAKASSPTTQSSKVPEPALPPRTPQPKRMPGMSGGAGAHGRGRHGDEDELMSQLAAGLAAPASEGDIFGQLAPPTGSMDPKGVPPAQQRQVGTHMPVTEPSTGSSEPLPGKKLHIHVPLGRSASSSPSAPATLPSQGLSPAAMLPPPGAAPPPPGAMPPPPGAMPPALGAMPLPPGAMPPMGHPPAFSAPPHPDSLQQQPPTGYPPAFSAPPHLESLHHHRPPPPSYPPYPPQPHYPAYPGYQPFSPQPLYWQHHPPPPPPGGATNQFPPPPAHQAQAPTESKPPSAAAYDFPAGKIICDGGELIASEGRIVVDGGEIVTVGVKSQKPTQPSEDDIPDGPIICDGGNMWIGERVRYEETQAKNMQSATDEASETRSLQQALTESLKNLGSDLVMGNASMLDDYEEGYESDEPLDIIVDQNTSKPIDPRSANGAKPVDPRSAGQKRKLDQLQNFAPGIDHDEI